MHLINNRSLNTLAVILLTGLLITAGCSGSGGGNPASPMLTGDNPTHTASAQGNHILWGMWDISVDPSTGNVDIVGLRGIMFNANVTKFLQPPSAPIHMLQVNLNPGSDFTTGHLDLDITLQHPFVGLNKFRGFDVRGIVMGDGAVQCIYDVYRADSDDLVLENPDGWTRWWNPTEFTTFETILGYTQGGKATPGYHASATLNAYKYFADSLDKDDPITALDTEQRGTFSVEQGVNTRRYILQFPLAAGMPSYKFNYAIDASWALPVEDYFPEYPVEAFPPEANTQEAWLATLDDTGTTAWYVNDVANGGSVTVNIEVFDWQGALQESGVEPEVENIILACPLFVDDIEITSTATVLPGGPASSVWSAEISDISLTSAGMFECWIAVEASSPINYAPVIDGDPGMFDWPDSPLVAYFSGTIEVSDQFPGDAPIVEAVIPDMGTQSTVITDVQVIGQNFQDGAVLEFTYDDGTPLDIANLVWVNSTLLTCDLDCTGPIGLYDITVTNPDTQFGTLDDGFEVIEPEQDSIWWESHMYNSLNIGQNPTVPGADPETLTEQWASPVSGDKKYCTPVVAEGKIFFTGNNGFYANDSMTAYGYDLYTGEQLWSNPINMSNFTSHRAFGSPVWWKGPDEIERVAVGGDQVYCFNAITGEELWTFDAQIDTYSANWISNQMQKWEGYVVARSHYSRLYVIDFMTGAEIQAVNLSQGSEGGCGIKDGLAYISSNHFIECADLTTGELLWTTPVPHDAYISHWMNPSIMEDRLYTTTYHGYVLAVAIAGNASYEPGEIIWEWHDTNIPAGSNPLVGGTSVVDNHIFVAAAFSGNYVYCIEDQGDEGVTYWKSSTTGYFDASPVWSSALSYPSGVVYCPDKEGFIRAYDAADGHQVWAYDTGGEFRAGVSPILDMLVVTSGTQVSVFKGP